MHILIVLLFQAITNLIVSFFSLCVMQVFVRLRKIASLRLDQHRARERAGALEAAGKKK